MGERVVICVLYKACLANVVSQGSTSTLFFAESIICCTNGHPGSVVTISSSSLRIFICAKAVLVKKINIKETTAFFIKDLLHKYTEPMY